MTNREDQGKNLLRLLQAAQPPPPASPLHHSDTTRSDYPALPATDVRSAAAGEQCYPDAASAADGISSDLLPRPGASATTPARSPGANLLRMLQQSPQQAGPAAEAPTPQQQHGRPHQPQHQHPQKSSASPPPPSTPRSGIAVEQERFLKSFLAIGGENSNNGDTGSLPFSPPPQHQHQHQRETLVPATPPRGVVGGNKQHASKGRNNSNNTHGRGRGGGREGRGRGGKNPQQLGGTGGREARKGRGRGSGGSGGGGGRGGPTAPTPSPKYAWSAFQNSPDPKSIPIPSLQHFNLDASPSQGEEGAGPEAGPLSPNWRESMEQQQQLDLRAGITTESLSTPPPAARAVRATGAESSSRRSAKKAEDDIKRMLRLG